MYFRNYRSVDWSMLQDKQVPVNLSHLACSLSVQKKSQLFEPMEPISISTLPHAFKMACDITGVHEVASMWLDSCFMEESAAAAYTARLYLKARSAHGSAQNGMITPYVQIVDPLLESNATDNKMGETEKENVRFTQWTNMSPLQYVDLYE